MQNTDQNGLLRGIKLYRQPMAVDELCINRIPARQVHPRDEVRGRNSAQELSFDSALVGGEVMRALILPPAPVVPSIRPSLCLRSGAPGGDKCQQAKTHDTMMTIRIRAARPCSHPTHFCIVAAVLLV